MSRRAGRNNTQSQNEPSASTSTAAADADDGGEDENLTDPSLLAVRYGMKNVIEMVEDLIPNCPDDAQKQMVKERLKALMLQFVTYEKSYLETEKIIEAVAEENPPEDRPVTENDTDLTADKFSPIVNERVSTFEKTLTDNVLKAHNMYKRLLKEIEKYERGEASEDEPEVMNDESILAEDTTAEHITTIDPITKLKLTDPVRNSKCKHIYGKVAMLELIKKNSKIRCPNMGCSNAAFIRASHLISDPKLTAAVLKKQMEEEAQEED